MADTKISALTDGAALAATDRIPVARSPFASGDNRYITGTQLSEFVLADLPVRELLGDVRTYYVATDGSDANDGLTEETAWLTPFFAGRWIANNLDFGGNDVTIQFADGTYQHTGVATDDCVVTLYKNWAGGGALIYQGNESDRTAVVFEQLSTSAQCVIVGTVYPIYFRHIRMKVPNASSFLIFEAIGTGEVTLTSCDMEGSTNGGHILAGFAGSKLNIDGDYTIATNTLQHIKVADGAHCGWNPDNIYAVSESSPGTVTCSGWFNLYYQSKMSCLAAPTKHGTFNGFKVYANTMSLFNSFLVPMSSLPGSTTFAAEGNAYISAGNGASVSQGIGAHSAVASETVTGYITVYDNTGNARKLAVLS